MSSGPADRGRLLPATGGLDAPALMGLFAAHAIPGVDAVDVRDATLTRAVRLTSGHRAVTVAVEPAGVRVFSPGLSGSDRTELGAVVRAWLDLDTDLAPVNAVLAADPLLAPLVAARPGLRVAGCLDPFEAAATTVLGQQVSLAACRTFAGRLVAAYGSDGPAGLRTFPAAEAVAGAAHEDLRAAVGITNARARTLRALAGAFLRAGHAEGEVIRKVPESPWFPLSRAELLALPGIGEWTADYLAVRASGDRDAFAPGDLVLRRALGGISTTEAAERARNWSPYRAHALMHLWTSTAY